MSVVARRSYGTGSLFVRANRRGDETWFGQWRVDGVLVKRRIGPKRARSSSEGLTKSAAERELRRMIESMTIVPTVMDIEEAGKRWLAHLEAIGRRKSTLMDYESAVRIHLVPFFGTRPIGKIVAADVERFMVVKRGEGRSPKSVRNWLGVLHSLLSYAEKRDWIPSNPCRKVDFPRIEETDADIRFLAPEGVEALLRAVDLDHEWGPTEHSLYLTAAMTGLRQGELLALRWRDVDWLAGRVRVRRNYVRGEFGAPKSRRSSRSVPMADRLMAELDAQHLRSRFRSDDDLVFAHPLLGRPLDRSRLLKRFKIACSIAGLRGVRFHDLRHTFGTRMAAAGVPMRTLQEWMGHRDFKTTLIYADYAPSAHERAMVEAAFAPAAAPPMSFQATTSTSDT
jgi:integrase